MMRLAYKLEPFLLLILFLLFFNILNLYKEKK